MTRLLLLVTVISTNVLALSAESLPPLSVAPQSVEQLWAGYDPQAEPPDVRVARMRASP